MSTGVVFDIKEFAIHDGPGIRTTVFMKGCPLRCRWCHNPEGLSPYPQLMVSQGACVHCGACEAACRHTDCIACGACVPYCRLGLRRIVGERWEPAALAKRLLKDADVYAQSGGGVTFSGGEPLMQWDFVKETLDLLPGIHTAVETSGYASDRVFSEVLEKFSLVMMDIKLTDPDLHKSYTGVDCDTILRHAKTLCEADTSFIIRLPIIPGVNDNLPHFQVVAGLLDGAKALLGVEVLPYQQTAGAKYAMVGLTYDPGFDPSQGIRVFTAPFEKQHIPIKVFS